MSYPMTPSELLAEIQDYTSGDEDLLAVLARASAMTVPMEAIYEAYDALSVYPDAVAPDPTQLDLGAQRILAGAAGLIDRFKLTHRSTAALKVFVAVADLLPVVEEEETQADEVDAEAAAEGDA